MRHRHKTLLQMQLPSCLVTYPMIPVSSIKQLSNEHWFPNKMQFQGKMQICSSRFFVNGRHEVLQVKPCPSSCLLIWLTVCNLPGLLVPHSTAGYPEALTRKHQVEALMSHFRTKKKGTQMVFFQNERYWEFPFVRMATFKHQNFPKCKFQVVTSSSDISILLHYVYRAKFKSN